MAVEREVKLRLIDLYSLYANNEITLEQMAQSLEINPRAMSIRIAKWGHRLPLMLSVLDKIADNKISRAEAAGILEVTDRAVNKLCENWDIKRPLGMNKSRQALASVKFELRKKAAIDYISGGMTIEEAAESADCSTRQIRRWVADLLEKHFEMTQMDLRALSDKRRRSLADEIQKAEKIDFDTQVVLDSIRRGETSIQEVGASRIAQLKAVKSSRKER